MKRFYAQAVAVFATSLAVVSLAAPGLAQGPEASQDGAAWNALADNPVDHRSDSPGLQVPEALRDYPPLVLPQPLPASQTQNSTEASSDPLAVVEYNVVTGETTQLLGQGPASEDSGVERSTPGFEGIAASPADLESVFPPDGRARVTNTAAFPWRTIVKLFADFSGGSGWCSGAIVGCGTKSFHVLTAGHCVYNDAYGGWAEEITVYPGLDGGYAPYNYAVATTWRTYTGWTVYQQTEHDWALVTLDRSVGNYTGWMGRQTAGQSSSIYTGNLTTAGYPCNASSVACTHPVSPVDSMWTQSDLGRTATLYNHWYYMDTQPGQSGSPVWRTDPGTGARYILTVHTTGNDGSSSNHGTRLEQTKYDDIATWCSADPLPNDVADLIDDGQAYSGFSPTTVDPGGTSFSVWNDVRNIGTLPTTAFNVKYYASVDTTITSSDYLIGTLRMNPAVTPFTYRTAQWTGTFPTSPAIPNNTYWVGWIIDADLEVPELDDGNNTARKEAYKLTVCDRPPAPVLAQPPNGASECEAQPGFDWSDTAGATSYRIQVDDDPAFGSPEYNRTPATSLWSPDSPLSGGTHYWRVAASNSCGQGPWSLVRSYTVRQISEAPELISPGDGRFTCQSRAVFHWNPVAMATSYLLEVDTDLSLASPQLEQTVTESYYWPAGALDLGNYEWRVTAENECGQGPTADIWTFDVLACGPVYMPIIHKKAP